MIKLILTCFALIALSLATVGCGDDITPARSLPSYMRITVTPVGDETYCNGRGYTEQGTMGGDFEEDMYAERSPPSAEAFDIHLFPESSWPMNFQGIRIDSNGHFKAWSHSPFLLLEADVTKSGIDGHLTIYSTDQNNVPSCRYVWHIKNL